MHLGLVLPDSTGGILLERSELRAGGGDEAVVCDGRLTPEGFDGASVAVFGYFHAGPGAGLVVCELHGCAVHLRAAGEGRGEEGREDCSDVEDLHLEVGVI